MPTRIQNSNKGTFGKVLNFCGSDNFIGAAYLSAVSSLTVGAGFSALASVQSVINSVSAILPEVVYLNREEGLSKISEFSVVLIGCGLGQNDESENLLKNVLLNVNTQIPVIIDADGLNIISNNVIEPSLFTSKDGIIITPHPLEASRLLSCTLEQVLNNLEDSAKELSKKYNCVTVLKTHRTIICDRNLTIHINQYGNSALAKAGSGDVLAGVIAGLIAQKMTPFEASKLGVYLHSRAGEIASEELTEYSVLASDIPKYLHKVIKEII